MAGVPGFITDLGWWAIVPFLFMVVFFRSQGTYWVGRWLRRGADAVALQAGATEGDSSGATAPPPPATARSRIAQKMSGPAMDRAQQFLEKWGFIGVPLCFLTVGFQTIVLTTAGYTRMRWDLFTVAMLPGCAAWAFIYGGISVTLIELWKQSPWWFLGGVITVVALAYGATRLRRNAGSAVRIPQ
ncbi:hypothetical protein ON058_05440 [Demequina sp. B12]|uniref:hypothetical protein n=1 Tax=Demequina sp. B12 TaxID=2992757 RepID=UPI00237A8928|nr:hypothetical protein [Demequina sp. B12]MDE0572857.1 hypothetical protein [Demequina sp. B12]